MTREGTVGPLPATRSILLALVLLAAPGCGTTSPATPSPTSSAVVAPSMPITVDAACGVRQVPASGAVWAASPPYVTVVLPPGVGSPYLAPAPGMTSADPRVVEQVPARFTVLDPDHARVDGPSLAAPVMLTRLPAGAPMSVCRP